MNEFFRIIKMLCQNCRKREATVNHIEAINGKACALHLCEMCANEMFGNFEQEVQNAVLSGLFGDGKREEKICPACGLSFSEYEKSGLLGCPSCYDVFKEELLPYIQSIQGETVHVGKGGGVYTSEHDLRIELKSLQEAMESAMLRGDYTEADRINEQMNAVRERDLTAKLNALEKALAEAKIKGDYAEVGRLNGQIKEIKAAKERKSRGWQW